MNYFEHHIGDYDQATAHLSGVEDGMYHRLIRRYMATEKPLPADVPALQRLVRAHTKEEKKAVQTVLAEFFELRDDGYHQHRCDEEIARFQEKSAKAKRSAEARWSAQRPESEGNADAYANASAEHDAPAMRTHSEGNAPRARPQTPDTKHQTPNTSSSEAKLPAVLVGAEDPAPPAPPPAADAAPTPRGTRLSSDWVLPKAWGEWALAEMRGWTPDVVRTEAAKFRDFWVSKTGKDATKLDWQATWRNWCRNARPQLNGRPAPAPIDVEARNAEARRLLGFEPTGHGEVLDA